METLVNFSENETIFDYFDREINKITDFNWKLNSTIFLSQKDVINEGQLCEFNESNENDHDFYYIATKDCLIRFNTSILASSNKLKEPNEGCLRLFFPILGIVKDTKRNLLGFSLTCHGNKRMFFNKNRSEIQTWFNKLSEICILKNLKSDFNLCNTIGSGNFSIVNLAIKRKDKKEYAIKTMFLDKIYNKIKHIEAVINEISILRMLNHPNIIKLYEVYYSEVSIHLVFEYLKGGELFEYIDKKGLFTEEEAKNIIQKLISILKYLHEHDIIHRDLKPENILLQNKNEIQSLKIADFGLSVINKKNEIQFVRCGSPGFVSPESLNKEGYNQKADMFSVGIIAYVLLVGYPPFQCETFKDTLIANKNCQINYQREELKKVSESALKFVMQATCRDPFKRISAEEATKHEWFYYFDLQRHNSILTANFKANMEKLENQQGNRGDNNLIDSPLLTRTPLYNRRQLSKNNSKNLFKYLANSPVEKKTQKSKFNQDFEEVFEIAEEFDFYENEFLLENNILTVEKKMSEYNKISTYNGKEKITEVKRRISVPLKQFFEQNIKLSRDSNIVKESASRSILKSKGQIPSSKTSTTIITLPTKESEKMDTNRIQIVPLINK